MRVRNSFPLLFLLCLSCQTSRPGYDGNNLYTLKIYHTNDIHAHLSPNAEGRGGLAYFASVLKGVREKDPNAIIVDAGDFYKKGSLPSQNSKDEVTADLISNMPYYDLRAVGNNEVKVGIPRLLDWAKKKEPAPLLSANFVDKNHKPVFKPFIILKRLGLRIGVIGLTVRVPIEENVQADPKTDPRAPYEILEPNDAVLPIIKELRPQVDILILVSHNHYTENVKLAKANPELDLVVSGHSHSLTGDQKTRGGNLVVEAGQFGQQVGAVTLVFDSLQKKVVSIESTTWPIGEDFQLADGSLAALVRKGYSKWAPDSFVRLGKATETLKVIDPVTPFEGTLNNWMADQFCEVSKCDVALVNREMLREPLYKGWITKEAIFLSAPYDDRVAVIKISKVKLVKMLKGNIERSFAKVGFFPFSFSGILSQVNTVDGKFKSVSLHIESPKNILTVALPNYITNHCLEFFKDTECPLPHSELSTGVRPLFEIAVGRKKEVHPPPADRVVIHEKSESN